ncbi:MAG: PilZ domain-containing protein [Proteobacteria bacterium]|nr:PilZ domain-containing protein [Pseudomonadota bacterium]
MEELKFFEFAFIVPHLTINFPAIRDFLKQAGSKFSRESLREIQLHTWVGSDSLGILFRFDPAKFHPGYFKWFLPWKNKFSADLIEMEKLGEAGRDLLIDKRNLTSDIKFVGAYDLPHALDIIANRLQGIKGVRKAPRIPARVKVSFRTERVFKKEYSENISYGGMFIQGKSDLPLHSRLEVILELPNREEVKVISEIVHIVTADQLKLSNGARAGGFGVQFVNFVGDGEKKLREYYESLLEICLDTENKSEG